MLIHPSLFLKRRVVLLLASACPLLLIAQNPAFEPKLKPQKATVSILATSYRVHQGSSGNRDVYIADLMLAPGEHTMVVLLDIYQETGKPIAPSVLHDHLPLHMDVMRDNLCDTTQGKLILPRETKDVYDGSLLDILRKDAAQDVPCYRTVHGSITLVKR